MSKSANKAELGYMTPFVWVVYNLLAQSGPSSLSKPWLFSQVCHRPYYLHSPTGTLV